MHDVNTIHITAAQAPIPGEYPAAAKVFARLNPFRPGILVPAALRSDNPFVPVHDPHAVAFMALLDRWIDPAEILEDVEDEPDRRSAFRRELLAWHAEGFTGLPLRPLSAGATNHAREEWKARAKEVRIEDECARRGIKLRRQGRDLVGPCPKCREGDDRFAVTPAEQLFNVRKCCDVGGDVIDMVVWLDGRDFNDAVEYLTNKPPPKANGHAHSYKNGKDHDQEWPKPDWKNPEAEFLYHDAEGNPIYQNVRFKLLSRDGSVVMSKKGKPDKTFLQRRPNGKGGWINRLSFKEGDATPAVEAVPYHLPDIIAAIEVAKKVGEVPEILIFEGELKADFVHKGRDDVFATSIPRNAKNYGPRFAGARVVIPG